ncbi:hypothetical protein RIF29_16542 [Crotalaria pallida]|uniref:Uncharacterized protein n=1 Tax=Crotalaria pallida TaxID=3830 RepID=A0AAN9IJX2_CROPI
MCRICGSAVSKPVQRFRIPIVVADSTASMTLFLLDRDARVMLKQSCSDIFPSPLPAVEPKVYRDFMSKLAGSQHRFKVEVSNVSNDFNVRSNNGKVPNNISKGKEGLKRNLNIYHDMCYSGETSKGVKFSKIEFVNGASSSYSNPYTSTRAPE